MTDDDHTLLRNYATRRSEPDFAALVRRHLDFVYSTALRQVNGDAHLAEDVTQLVFTDLARKAGKLSGHRALAGWLHTSARYAAAKLVRTEARRRHREQEAQIMQESDRTETEAAAGWEEVRPVLDEVLGEMDERDREVIILRLLEGCDYAEVGARTALTDNAARMRTERALDKLRALLARRGITSSAAALTAALSAHAVTAAPAGLAATVTATALGGTAAVGGGAIGAIFMSMSKLQIGLAAGIVAAGAGGYAWQESEATALRNELYALRETPAPAPTAGAKPPAGLPAIPAPTAIESEARTDAELARLEVEASRMQAELQSRGGTGPRPMAGPVLDISQVDRKPKPSFQAQPKYPLAMRREGVEGDVIVSFVIDENGEVADARVVKSSQPGFDESALVAVRQWQFSSAEKDRRKVSVRVEQMLKFRIGGKAEPPAPWF